jgi:hypothetical protein
MRPTLHFRKKRATEIKCPAFFENILWGAFFIPLGSLSLVIREIACIQNTLLTYMYLELLLRK